MHAPFAPADQTEGYRQIVEELEQAWLAHLRATRPQPPSNILAAGRNPSATNRVVVRQTVPPAQPPSAAVIGQGGASAGSCARS